MIAQRKAKEAKAFPNKPDPAQAPPSGLISVLPMPLVLQSSSPRVVTDTLAYCRQNPRTALHFAGMIVFGLLGTKCAVEAILTPVPTITFPDPGPRIFADTLLSNYLAQHPGPEAMSQAKNHFASHEGYVEAEEEPDLAWREFRRNYPNWGRWDSVQWFASDNGKRFADAYRKAYESKFRAYEAWRTAGGWRLAAALFYIAALLSMPLPWLKTFGKKLGIATLAAGGLGLAGFVVWEVFAGTADQAMTAGGLIVGAFIVAAIANALIPRGAAPETPFQNPSLAHSRFSEAMPSAVTDDEI